MPNLPETTIRRLILVRQIFLHAARHSADPTEIGRIIAIQTADYAVETLLTTIVSHFGRPTDYLPPAHSYHNKITSLKNQTYNPEMKFRRLWDEVLAIFRDPELGIGVLELLLRREIDELHEMRNNVQHKGIVPASTDVRKYLAYAESFLRDVSRDAFGKDLDEATLASLIEDNDIRALLLQAEIAFDKSLYSDCIIEASKAFTLATSKEQKRQSRRRR